MNEQQDTTLNTAKEVLVSKKDVPMDMDHWQSLLGKEQKAYNGSWAHICIAFIDALTPKLTTEHQFPLLDVSRSLILTKAAGNYYTSNCM